MSNIRVYIIIMTFVLDKSLTRDHFKGKVFKNPFKVKHLVDFRLELCKELHNCEHLHRIELNR